MTLSSLIAHQNRRDDHPIAAFYLKPHAASIGASQTVILNKRPFLPRVKDLEPGASSRPIPITLAPGISSAPLLPSCKATDFNR